MSGTNSTEYTRAYYAAHREEAAAYQARYYEANRAKILARKRGYHRSKGRTSGTIIADPDQSDAANVEPAMTYDEIAAELGITKAAVGQIVTRALQKLRRENPRLAELLR